MVLGAVFSKPWEAWNNTAADEQGRVRDHGVSIHIGQAPNRQVQLVSSDTVHGLRSMSPPPGPIQVYMHHTVSEDKCDNIKILAQYTSAQVMQQ